MSQCSRRSVISALGAAMPLGLAARAGGSEGPESRAPELRFRPFEEAVRGAFAGAGRSPSPVEAGGAGPCPVRRVEVGDCDPARAGVQGCHNDRPFAGFPAGHLRIVRAGSEPGPVRQGVRLYVSTVDVALTGGLAPGDPSRPLDFASLPPAPMIS